MIGTGALAPQIVRAHAAVRPLERVVIWGRNAARARQTARGLSDLSLKIEAADDLADGLAAADIISSATASTAPLVAGRHIRAGTHVDLVGSFTPEMREADDALLRRARLFVDTSDAFEECGELVEALARGIIDRSAPDLGAIARTPALRRRSNAEITVFKAVGTSLADLAIARHLEFAAPQNCDAI
jgi:ornithine cyclodeaminase